jgi:hypothetical protein
MKAPIGRGSGSRYVTGDWIMALSLKGVAFTFENRVRVQFRVYPM